MTPLEYKSELIAIKYALAVDIASVLGQLTASGPGTAVGKSPRTGGLNNPVSYQQGQNQGNPGQPQQPAQSPYGTGATGNRSNFQNRLQQIVQKASQAGEFQILGEAKIIPDERTNSLLIFANDSDMKMIKSIISKMDVVLAQVLIEAIIMEVSLDNGRNLGVSYLQRPNHGFNAGGGVNNGQPFISPIGNFVTGSNSSPLNIQDLAGGLSYFAKIGSSLDVAVKAIAADTRVNVLSRPRIQTSHAVEASLFIGDTVPYVTGTYFGGGFSGGPSSQYQQREVGIRLNVLPLINPDGLVVMDIQQDIEQLGTPVSIPSAGDVPTTTKRQAAAKVA
ncbi:MAG: type II secretion system protein GspD, partial [Limisphaerales bacterium]